MVNSYTISLAVVDDNEPFVRTVLLALTFAHHLARARGAPPPPPPPADRPARAALRQPTAVANFFFANSGLGRPMVRPPAPHHADRATGSRPPTSLDRHRIASDRVIISRYPYARARRAARSARPARAAWAALRLPADVEPTHVGDCGSGRMLQRSAALVRSAAPGERSDLRGRRAQYPDRNSTDMANAAWNRAHRCCACA